MAEGLGREEFAECVGSTLSVLGTDGAEVVALRVEAVQDYGEKDGRRFSVHFHGPADPFLPQATYRAAVDGGEPFDLFVVPVGRTGDGFEYEAAFNRTG